MFSPERRDSGKPSDTGLVNEHKIVCDQIENVIHGLIRTAASLSVKFFDS